MKLEDISNIEPSNRLSLECHKLLHALARMMQQITVFYARIPDPGEYLANLQNTYFQEWQWLH